MNEDISQPSPESPPAEMPATAPGVKSSLQELLKYGFLEEARKPVLFRASILHEDALNRALEPLDLALKLDTHRGIAFLVVAENAREEKDAGEEWSHPLVRRQRLTLEQSLLLALLRQEFLRHEQEAGVGHGQAKVSLDDLMPQFQAFLGDSGSDSRNESRLSSLLDHLKGHGVISEIDKNGEVTLRPLIAHLANAESLTALLQEFVKQAKEGNPES